ncbi:hypothetical protein ACSBM8_11085 [Sphingomonas sp. ASY06-1R]|uniref:hypothetical protein n=1 Tax=Sphingomonas sp. ASY06-1R TaxID=3445771 RepID=UPI003FA30D61
MTISTIDERVHAARAATDERLEQFPGHPLFLYASRDIARVEERLASGAPIDQAFYDSLNVGLMCARELEAVDMPFCDTIYAMLEEVRQHIA